MNTSKLIFILLCASFLGGVLAIGGYKLLKEETQSNQGLEEKQNIVLSKYSSTPDADYIVPEGLNFIEAAGKVTPAVVHIKTMYDASAASNRGNSFEDMFKEYFGDRGYGGRGRGQQISSGSGVIITDDGYIATNNHVVDHASTVEVILDDKRSYQAEIVGTDPTTDLALLKIKESGLPFVPFGDSDNVKVGQWVLAVGNPFDLTSTVTAGIVSAKARNINILRSRGNDFSIESFIQTDAAVNPGNSGGALVDLNGKLIGINTAIATNTGSYSGYSFAVPVTLVKKVMDDLLNYGEVQRALMGVRIADVDAALAEREGIDKIEGVYVASVSPGGGADDAGIIAKDIIIAIDGTPVNSTSELQELIARNRPGDKVAVTLRRGNQEMDVNIELKNMHNTTEAIVRSESSSVVSPLGAKLDIISEKEKEALNIQSGVKVTELSSGKLQKAGVQEGFIITHVDKKEVESVEELSEIIQQLEENQGGVLIEGVYPDGSKGFYGIGF